MSTETLSVFRKPVQVFNLGRWQINIMDEHERVPEVIVAALTKYLHERWRPTVRKIKFPYSWAGLAQYKVPSPIIRVDMSPVVSPSGLEHRIYEFEYRPGGIGMLLKFFPELVEVLRQALPKFTHLLGQRVS